MDKVELANNYLSRGYFVNMTAEQIRSEISRADKRTYNGKMTRTFNNSKP